MLTGSWLRAAVMAWALAAASYGALRLNFERAPAVHVRWSAAVDARARAALETQFALADGIYDSGQTWVYLLTSPTPANIQALVQSPAVEDTHHIDRQQFRVSAEAPRRGPYIGRGPASRASASFWSMMVSRPVPPCGPLLRPFGRRSLRGLWWQCP